MTCRTEAKKSGSALGIVTRSPETAPAVWPTYIGGGPSAALADGVRGALWRVMRYGLVAMLATLFWLGVNDASWYLIYRRYGEVLQG